MKVLRVAAIALLLGVCACQESARPAPGDRAGSGSPSPSTDSRLLGTATENARSATSVTADFRVLLMGQLVTGTLSVDNAGHCGGSVESEKLGRAELLSDGTHFWIKAGERFWGAERTAQIGGRYVTGPASDDPFRSLAIFCHATRSILSGDHPFGDMTEQGRKEADGIRTVSFVDREGSRVDVSDTGAPHITRIRSGRDTEPSDWTYREYGKALAFTAPPADATLDVTTILPPKDNHNG